MNIARSLLRDGDSESDTIWHPPRDLQQVGLHGDDLVLAVPFAGEVVPLGIRLQQDGAADQEDLSCIVADLPTIALTTSQCQNARTEEPRGVGGEVKCQLLVEISRHRGPTSRIWPAGLQRGCPRNKSIDKRFRMVIDCWPKDTVVGDNGRRTPVAGRLLMSLAPGRSLLPRCTIQNCLPWYDSHGSGWSISRT